VLQGNCQKVVASLNTANHCVTVKIAAKATDVSKIVPLAFDSRFPRPFARCKLPVSL